MNSMINYGASSRWSPTKEWDKTIAEYLQSWTNYYRQRNKKNSLVTVHLGGVHYLFDVTAERLVAAIGVSPGKVDHKRDKSRMGDHPKGGGDDVHRGHAFPHSMGGGLDINLVPQLGKLNTGKFRVLEEKAKNIPGSLYYTHWIYDNPDVQRPYRVEQGLLTPGQTGGMWNESFSNQ